MYARARSVAVMAIAGDLLPSNPHRTARGLGERESFFPTRKKQPLSEAVLLHVNPPARFSVVSDEGDRHGQRDRTNVFAPLFCSFGE